MSIIPEERFQSFVPAVDYDVIALLSDTTLPQLSPTSDKLMYTSLLHAHTHIHTHTQLHTNGMPSVLLTNRMIEKEIAA